MTNNMKYSSLNNMIGSTDTFAQISNISLSYGTKSALLADALPIQLYQMCVANGIQDSYNEFVGEVNNGFIPNGVDTVTGYPTGKVGLSGTVLRLMFGKDIAWIDMIPRLNVRYSFKMDCTIKNVNYHTPIQYELWMITIHEGIVSLTGSDCVQLANPIPSKAEVIAAPLSTVSFTAYEAVWEVDSLM